MCRLTLVLSLLLASVVRAQVASAVSIIRRSSLQPFCSTYAAPTRTVTIASTTQYYAVTQTQLTTLWTPTTQGRIYTSLTTSTRDQIIATAYSSTTVYTFVTPPPRVKRDHIGLARKQRRQNTIPRALQQFPTKTISAACSSVVTNFRTSTVTARGTAYVPYTENTLRTVTSPYTVYADQTVFRTATVSVRRTSTSYRTVTSTCTAPRPTQSAYSNLLSKNGINIGIVPDYGEIKETDTLTGDNGLNAQIAVLGNVLALRGEYAQAHSGTLFDGSQLLGKFDDIKNSGAIFEPAVMPVGGWWGLTYEDNQQAVAICNVMKQFTDAGIETRLRFAHEANWYQTDGTYQGTVSDFQEGWDVVATTCKSIDSSIKMSWTPNVDSMTNYRAYAPRNFDTVDFSGVDFYPRSLSSSNSFINTMQGFYNAFVTADKPFIIAETGLGYAGSIQDRISWFSSIIASKSTFPNLQVVAWFNYFKDNYDYKIISRTDQSVTDGFLKYMAC